jgi:hypothetical protein
MNIAVRMGLPLIFLLQLSLSGFAQSGIITTYVGSSQPTEGAQAITQPINLPSAVALRQG